MNADIVKIESYNNIIIDKKFYTNQFEDECTPQHDKMFFNKVRTYPVNVVGL